jgi:hypothetical protein
MNYDSKIASATAEELRAMLPDSQNGRARWVVRRKAALIKLYDIGGITDDEITQRYAMSIEELKTWRARLERGGMRAMRQTRIQDSRP